jgi:hypothetical protein
MKTLSLKEIKYTAPWFSKVSPRQPDANYNVPKLSWVKEKLIPFYFSWIKGQQLSEYSEKFDCDDFSTWFRMLAKACHRHSTGTAESLSVFEIWYNAQGTGGVNGNHSIIAVYTGKWVFIEPQNGSIYQLTKDEINSIFHVIP